MTARNSTRVRSGASPTRARVASRSLAPAKADSLDAIEPAAPYAPTLARDPARMTPTERRAELCALLAAGLLRLSAKSAKAVALGGQTSPVCEATRIDGSESHQEANA